MDYQNVISERFKVDDIFTNADKLLLVVFGVFGDFDSFEFAQALCPKLKAINDAGIKLIIVGIGSEVSKKKFSEYTKIPLDYLEAVQNSDFHNKLLLNKGSSFFGNELLNLLIMCAGFNSPGTFNEVFRGYIGDSSAHNIYSQKDCLFKYQGISINGSLFEWAGRSDHLRPFELATRRLKNMIEILSKWNSYISKSTFITQRGATFMFNRDWDILYEFRPTSLLGYSENMSMPLQFLDCFL